MNTIKSILISAISVAISYGMDNEESHNQIKTDHKIEYINCCFDLSSTDPNNDEKSIEDCDNQKISPNYVKNHRFPYQIDEENGEVQKKPNVSKNNVAQNNKIRHVNIKLRSNKEKFQKLADAFYKSRDENPTLDPKDFLDKRGGLRFLKNLKHQIFYRNNRTSTNRITNPIPPEFTKHRPLNPKERTEFSDLYQKFIETEPNPSRETAQSFLTDQNKMRFYLHLRTKISSYNKSKNSNTVTKKIQK